MRYKIVVRHKGGNVSRYEFPARSAWADHYVLYVREVDDGYFIAVELWKRIDAIATGEPGEQLWQLVSRHPKGN